MAMYKIASRSKENLKRQPTKVEKRQKEAKKKGFACKKLRRIIIDKFEKFRLNFSKLSSVTELYSRIIMEQERSD